MNPVHIYNSSGRYVGFVSNNNLFRFNGEYLGWLEDRFVWDKSGQFKGLLQELNGHHYILRNTLQIAPIPRVPRVHPATPPIPPPETFSIQTIVLPVGIADAF